MKKKTAIKKNFLICDNLAAPAVLAAVWRTDQRACFKILPFSLPFAAEEVDASNPCIFDSFAVQIGLFWAFVCLAEDSPFSVLLNELTPLFSDMWLSQYWSFFVSAIDAFKRKLDTFERTLLSRLFRGDITTKVVNMCTESATFTYTLFIWKLKCSVLPRAR